MICRNFSSRILAKTIWQNGLSFIVLLFLFTGCAAPLHPPEPIYPVTAFVPEDVGNEVSRFAPVFLVDESDKSYNLIGRPMARIDEDGDEEIYVDSREPAIFWQKLEFTTDRGRYTNLVYRIHFPEVPFNLIPFHLTSGDNVGLIVVVTLNDKQEPVLLTMVNTCGCYLGIIPTTFLPEDAYPEDWDTANQFIYGEYLPGLITYNSDDLDKGSRLFMIHLRGGTHRVKCIQPLAKQEELAKHETVITPLLNIAKLDLLQLDGTTTSFFETTGPKKGLVKGSNKIWERLFMSWWALDWNIGMDKRYGPSEEMETVFYTSLKIWARDDSDMWNFPRFLKYWGWNL